jgi:CII-binding regulator of phage lambda lysogenization HflD
LLPPPWKRLKWEIGRNKTMTSEQRLDRIERVLETLASNQVAERDARLAMREDLELLYQTVRLSGENTDTAIAQLTQRIDRLSEQMELLGENTNTAIAHLTERVDLLTEDFRASVQDLVGMIAQLAEDAERERAEIRQIWEYLLRVSGNGKGEQ